MSPLDRYLNQVARHLAGMSAKVRRDVLQELRSNIEAQSMEEGGDLDAIIERMGSPREAAYSYKQLYGYGLGVKVLSVIGAAALAFLSLPFTFDTAPALGTVWLSNAALVILILLLVGVGVRIGKRTSITAGIGAAAVRFAALAVGFAFMASGLSYDPIASVAFILTTAAIAVVGYVASPRDRTHDA